jgi:hypothetical protein
MRLNRAIPAALTGRPWTVETRAGGSEKDSTVTNPPYVPIYWNALRMSCVLDFSDCIASQLLCAAPGLGWRVPVAVPGFVELGHQGAGYEERLHSLDGFIAERTV